MAAAIGFSVMSQIGIAASAARKTIQSLFVMCFSPKRRATIKIARHKNVETPPLHAPLPAPSRYWIRKAMAVRSVQMTHVKIWGLFVPLSVAQKYGPKEKRAKATLSPPQISGDSIITYQSFRYRGSCAVCGSVTGVSVCARL